MTNKKIRDYILDLLNERLLLFDINRGELNNDFDLVKSGLLDSMAFIDLLAEAEEKFEVEIDFEQLAESDDFTSLGGLVNIIMNTKNAE
ncbi:MAG: acyl carrier protein [Bacteroidetes bacterium]|nr:acyl carrier protein [Bacteroidota bacterium]